MEFPVEKLIENVIYHGRKGDFQYEFFLYKKQHYIFVTQKYDGGWHEHECEITRCKKWSTDFSKLIVYTSLETLLTHPSRLLRERAKELMK